MQERQRSTHEMLGPGPGGLGSFFSNNSDQTGTVTVSCGAYAEQIGVAGMSVGEVRARFRDRFNIDPNSQAILDGQEVGDDTTLRAGQVLTFIRKAGEKGAVVWPLHEQVACATGDVP